MNDILDRCIYPNTYQIHIRWVGWVPTHSDPVYCMWVNARNKKGVYTGWHVQIYLPNKHENHTEAFIDKAEKWCKAHPQA